MDEKRKIKVSKLAAAHRQLDTAIDLWFRDRDLVSINALAFNAHEIIQDINKKKGNTEGTMLGMAQKLVKPDHVEEVMRLWKKPLTFLKHADRDPYDILEFDPELADATIVLCIFGLGLLGEQPSDLVRSFTAWGCLHRPHLFLKDQNPFTNSLSVEEIEDLRQVGKRDFLEQTLLGIAKNRIAR
jgi:hypothetical protein